MLFILFVVVVLLILPHFINGGVMLGTGRVMRYKITYWRGVLASVAMLVANLATLFIVNVVELKFENIWVAYMFLAAPTLLVLKLMLKVNSGKTVATWLAIAMVSLGYALGVRAVFFEGFIVPTGASAPVVLGEHYKVDCTNCGHTFSIDLSSFRNGPVEAAQCFSCGFMTEKIDGSHEGNSLFANKLLAPSRWDLAVFKAPHKPDTKFLKRVAGLPGETIELAVGDVFINGQRAVKPPDKYESLWLFVHDTERVPAVPSDAFPGWQPTEKDGWKQDGSTWSVSATGEKSQTLKYQTPLLNRTQYAEAIPGYSRELEPLIDIRVRVQIRQLSGRGKMELAWAIPEHAIRLECFANGMLKLIDGSEVLISTTVSKGLAGRTLELIMRDGVVSLLVDGKVDGFETLLAQGVEANRPTESEEQQQKPANNLAIVATDCQVDLSRITIHRDVFFESNDGRRVCFGCVGRPAQLADDEYYVLGDNSRYSYDSRGWTDPPTGPFAAAQRGTVPHAAMIGVAEMIYWPLSEMRVLRE